MGRKEGQFSFLLFGCIINNPFVPYFGQLNDTTFMLCTYSVQSALMGLATFACLWLIQLLF